MWPVMKALLRCHVYWQHEASSTASSLNKPKRVNILFWEGGASVWPEFRAAMLSGSVDSWISKNLQHERLPAVVTELHSFKHTQLSVRTNSRSELLTANSVAVSGRRLTPCENKQSDSWSLLMTGSPTPAGSSPATNSRSTSLLQRRLNRVQALPHRSKTNVLNFNGRRSASEKRQQLACSPGCHVSLSANQSWRW